MAEDSPTLRPETHEDSFLPLGEPIPGFGYWGHLCEASSDVPKENVSTKLTTVALQLVVEGEAIAILAWTLLVEPDLLLASHRWKTTPNSKFENRKSSRFGRMTSLATLPSKFGSARKLRRKFAKVLVFGVAQPLRSLPQASLDCRKPNCSIVQKGSLKTKDGQVDSLGAVGGIPFINFGKGQFAFRDP